MNKTHSLPHSYIRYPGLAFLHSKAPVQAMRASRLPWPLLPIAKPRTITHSRRLQRTNNPQLRRSSTTTTPYERWNDIPTIAERLRSTPTLTPNSSPGSSDGDDSASKPAADQAKTEAAEDEIEVRGWIRSIRKQKRVVFAAIGDGSTIDSLQAVLRPEDGEG